MPTCVYYLAVKFSTLSVVINVFPQARVRRCGALPGAWWPCGCDTV